MNDYRDLIVWQRAMDLTVAVYAYTKDFPPDEKYALVSQMRRAAVSVPSNIAEGSRRRGKDQRQLYVIAFGSASELETQTEVSKRLAIGNTKLREPVEALCGQVLRMLNKLTSDF